MSVENTVKRRLPIGIQTFRKIREENCYYVDKTDYIHQLVDGGQHYFLSRPRRFGKSLLLDTIKELFEDNEKLFRGLAIHDKWNWGQPRPVLRISFGRRNFTEPSHVEISLAAQLESAEKHAGLTSSHSTGPERFAALIEALCQSSERRVVILVDEYDKPILDALESPDVAKANREYLRGVYSVIKDCEESVKFTLLTGVSKFAKVSLFSGLNNLRDITLDRRYSAICGYKEQDLDDVFAPELPGLDREKVRRWYNGYNWRGKVEGGEGEGEGKGKGKEKVYNPFDILLLFDSREFTAHWFETGSPKFLIDALLRRGVPTLDLDGMVGSEALLSAFDVDEMSTEALLFQTGYLTIVDETDTGGRIRFRLGYPNQEVRQSLNERLLMALLPDASWRHADAAPLCEMLAANDFAGLEAFLRGLFAGIPHQWHINNHLENYEGYYASVVYSCFAAHGFDLIAEESSSAGRSDMVVRCDEGIYLFEFKLLRDEPAGANGTALAQIKEKGYAEKYRHLDKPIHLIGVEFSQAQRNLAAFEVEAA